MQNLITRVFRQKPTKPASSAGGTALERVFGIKPTSKASSTLDQMVRSFTGRNMTPAELKIVIRTMKYNQMAIDYHRELIDVDKDLFKELLLHRIHLEQVCDWGLQMYNEYTRRRCELLLEELGDLMQDFTDKYRK